MGSYLLVLAGIAAASETEPLMQIPCEDATEVRRLAPRDVSVLVDYLTAFEGEASLKLTHVEHGPHQARLFEIPVAELDTTERTITVSAMMRSESMAERSWLEVGVQSARDTERISGAEEQAVVGDTDWRRVSIPVALDPPNDETLSIAVRFHDKGTVWVDDVVVYDGVNTPRGATSLERTWVRAAIALGLGVVGMGVLAVLGRSWIRRRRV